MDHPQTPLLPRLEHGLAATLPGGVRKGNVFPTLGLLDACVKVNEDFPKPRIALVLVD